MSKSSSKSDTDILRHQLELLDERLLEVISLRQRVAAEVGNDKKTVADIMKKAEKKAKDLKVDPKLAMQIIDLVSKGKK